MHATLLGTLSIAEKNLKYPVARDRVFPIFHPPSWPGQFWPGRLRPNRAHLAAHEVITAHLAHLALPARLSCRSQSGRRNQGHAVTSMTVVFAEWFGRVSAD